ncbi:MAG: ASCH domain-containing protein [Dehalococcoidia bacterium]|jgi:hypothetical protein
MSDLHLHVKTEYFEAIKRGEKTEEYRRYNGYWRHILGGYYGAVGYVSEAFGFVVIHNAYKPGEANRLRFPWRGWSLKTITHPHFGPEPVTVFAIKLEK